MQVNSGTTVHEALVAKNIILQPLDRVTPELNTLIKNNDSILVIRIREEFSVLKETIPFEQQTIKNEGFFRYKDQNGDQVINEEDKVYLGSAIPWLISGVDVGITYKNFDLNISLMGQLGNKILNAKRMNRDVFTDGNYDQDFYENRWTKDSPSDEYPSATAYNYSFIQQANDFFVESGSYIRIQNIQAGFTTTKIPFIPQLRIYIAAQRPYTFFTYNGFTPEIGGSPISSGIDNSVYPLQSVYTVGIKANF
jgi:hypothetical protein